MHFLASSAKHPIVYSFHAGYEERDPRRFRVDHRFLFLGVAKMTEIAHEKGGFKNPILAFCLDKPALLNFDIGGCQIGNGNMLSALSERLFCFTVTYWQGDWWRPFLKINLISTKTGLAAI